MKNLLYKELKLCLHPIIYVFVLAFPLMIFIPSYPASVCLIYVCSAYPILFLGSNKGQQSNDIFYSSLLPVSKKDVVKARMITCSCLQFASMLIMLILSPAAQKSIAAVMASSENFELAGLNAYGILTILGFGLVGFSIYDAIFFLNFYKNGRCVTPPTLIGILVFLIFIMATTVVIPLSNDYYMYLFNDSSYLFQLLFFIPGLVIYLLAHYFIYKIASNRFEKVDL